MAYNYEETRLERERLIEYGREAERSRLQTNAYHKSKMDAIQASSSKSSSSSSSDFSFSGTSPKSSPVSSTYTSVPSAPSRPLTPEELAAIAEHRRLAQEKFEIQMEIVAFVVTWPFRTVLSPFGNLLFWANEKIIDRMADAKHPGSDFKKYRDLRARARYKLERTEKGVLAVGLSAIFANAVLHPNYPSTQTATATSTLTTTRPVQKSVEPQFAGYLVVNDNGIKLRATPYNTNDSNVKGYLDQGSCLARFNNDGSSAPYFLVAGIDAKGNNFYGYIHHFYTDTQPAPKNCVAKFSLQ